MASKAKMTDARARPQTPLTAENRCADSDSPPVNQRTWGHGVPCLNGPTMDASTTPPDLESAYAAKAAEYYVGARLDFVERLPRGPVGIDPRDRMRIGGDRRHRARAGPMCAVRRRGAHARACGAREARLSRVLVGDIEQMHLEFEPSEFDALILSEVLEHLREPGLLVERLAPLIRPGGVVLASSPNVSSWRVILTLLRGAFPAADRGVFDRTHLRWFTPRRSPRCSRARGSRCGRCSRSSRIARTCGCSTGSREGGWRTCS